MALTHSKYVRGAERVPTPSSAGEVVATRFDLTYVAGDYSDGDIVELGILPANCTIRGAVVTCDDLDTGTDFEFDIGLMSGDVGEALDSAGDARTCGDELFDGATTGRDAGSLAMTDPAGFRITPVDYDRSIGIKLIDQGTSTTGVLSLTVFYGS
jgi:hypothetical protein